MRFIDRTLTLSLIVALSGCGAPAPKPPIEPAQVAPVEPPPAAETPALETIDPILKRDFALAIAALHAGDDQRAEQLFLELCTAHPSLASPRTNLGMIYYRQGKLDEAENYLRQAVALNQQDYAALNYLGIVHRHHGRFKEARQAYEQSIHAKPDHAYAHLNLAILYDLYLGDLKNALQHYERYQQYTTHDDGRLAGWLADVKHRLLQQEAAQ